MTVRSILRRYKMKVDVCYILNIDDKSIKLTNWEKDYTDGNA